MTSLAHVGEQRPASIVAYAQPSTARPEIATGENTGKWRALTPARRKCLAGVKFVAVGGDHQGVMRMRVKRDNNQAHGELAGGGDGTNGPRVAIDPVPHV